MAESSVIAENVPATLMEQRSADVVIAILTFNDERTIGAVLNAARSSLVQFSTQNALIVQCDGGSSDSTMQRARDSLQGETCFAQVSYPIYPVHRMEVSHQYVPGKDSAYRTIFALAEKVDAKACCILDCDGAVTPDWIASLVQPVLEMGFDLAAPLYQRRRYEGLFVNSMLYPLLRALFGKRLTQPIGNDFGYSRAFIRQSLTLESWNTESARRDINLWLDVQALQYEMKLCQVRLGQRPHTTKDKAQDISDVLGKLTGALFMEMESAAALWQRIRGSNAVPVFGLRFDHDEGGSSPDTKSMIDAFRIGYENLHEIWGMVLPPATLLELKRMTRQTEREFRFPADVWARIAYDFSVAHRLRAIGREHLLQALMPLYMGWIASFILSTRESHSDQAENQLEQLCLAFESQKPYLISRWRWPDRFMP
jgi:glycosyltransferase involved in cell wall biosynthesis